MAGPVEHVTIVGGGTAGWLTACFLATTLNLEGAQRRVKVTVIESPNTPTIGVGEATVPGMPRMLRQLKIDEAAFMKACNASFKLGIKFVDWNRDADGQPKSFVHPFQQGPMIDGLNATYAYKKYGRRDQDFVDQMIPNKAAMEAGRAPKPFDAPPYEAPMAYAYHLDAGKFGAFLRDVCLTRGVKHVQDDVVDVAVDDRGFVTSLSLQERGDWPVELVVDCTGFRGIIIRQALGGEFEPWDDYLLCDRALAVQIPHENEKKIDPWTASTALEAGWVWRVPLFNRIGTGYVHSSRFADEATARAQFKAHLGKAGEGVEPRLLKFDVGRMRESWVGNCVAIGLSSGFVEPLESTAIYLIEMASRWLLESLPRKDMPVGLRRRFNRRISHLYEEVRDFVQLHYLLGNRDDPFWRAAREDVTISERQASNLEMWHAAPPSGIELRSNDLFHEWNVLYVLAGKGFLDDAEYSLSELMAEAPWRQLQSQLANARQAMASQLPSHYDSLRRLRGEDGKPQPRPARQPGAQPRAAGPQLPLNSSTPAAAGTFDPGRYLSNPSIRSPGRKR
jgi:tryptophan halogenase